MAAHGWLLWALAWIGAILTGAYTFRLYFMVFGGEARGPLRGRPMPLGMKIPLGILASASLLLGFIQVPDGWPGPHLLLPWLSNELGMPLMPHGGTAWVLGLLGAFASLGGVYLGWRLARAELAGRGTGRIPLLASGLYLDALYDQLFVRPAFALSRWLRDGIELATLNRALIGSLLFVLQMLHNLLSTTQNGRTARYAAYMTFGVVAMLGYLLW